MNRLILVLLLITITSNDLMAQKYSGRSSSSSSRSSSSSFRSSSSSRPSSSSSSSKSYSSPSKSSFGGSSLSKSAAQNSSKSKYTQSATKSSSTTTGNKSSVTNKPSFTSSSKPSYITKPKVEYTPQARNARYSTVVNNNYAHPYSYYASQPIINVGGGYSPVFWWMMMEWSAERRAQWMYHNQNTVNQTVYKETIVKDPELAAEIEKLKAANTKIDPEYVDKDFKDNPDLMYTQEHIETKIKEEPKTSWFRSMFLVFALVCVIGSIYIVSTIKVVK